VRRESVWDYPRPPAVVPDGRRVRVEFAGRVIAATTSAIRVLETSHPPTFYIPPGDVRFEWLRREDQASVCEWKGEATYWSVVIDGLIAPSAAWGYAKPRPAFAAIKDHVAFYAARVDACYVGDERVTPQAGGFYGGWITSEITGPFKGGPGTQGW
jgi:uncharacterized protein (DUF427 family)